MGFLWKCNRHEHKYQRFGIFSDSSVNNLIPQGLVQLYHQLWCLNRDVWSIWGVGKGEQKNPKVDLNEILSLRLCLNQTSPLGLDCVAVPPQPCSVPRQAVPESCWAPCVLHASGTVARRSCHWVLAVGKEKHCPGASR